MQILVISDTHGRYDVLRHVLLTHPQAELIVHCGDGEYETERFLAEHPEYAQKLIQVRGNCDHDPAIPLARTLPLPYGHKALIVHGHRYVSGDFPQNLIETAKADGADLVLFGHLHIRMDRYVDGIHLFNPGSAAQPRDQFSPSYGLVDIMESGILTAHGELQRTPAPFDDMFGF